MDTGISPWVSLLVPTMIWAAAMGLLRWRLVGGFLPTAVPWLALLCFLLYNEYMLSYRGVGASMWPLVQLWIGTITAIVAMLTCYLVQKMKSLLLNANSH